MPSASHSKYFIDNPNDLKNLKIEELNDLASEIRTLIIDTVSTSGGHLGASLGVVELTIALHYVFNTPDDYLIWDIGHQLLPHKILTKRRNQLSSWRKKGGISGFARRNESEFDHFGAGHSSTAISAALGFCAINANFNRAQQVIAIIGDSALSAGLAFEALNNAKDFPVIIILNDNDMSISPAVGGLYHHFNNIDPENNIFTNLGLDYIGIIDGHNIKDLIEVLISLRGKSLKKAIVVHIKTIKGHGFYLSGYEYERYHAVPAFNTKTLSILPTNNQKLSYSEVFARQLICLMQEDPSIIGITAAMLSGTGLEKVANVYPNRVYDVGIAEPHAVTFAAGVACKGGNPFVAIFSTFLQRAYDQVIHDVAIQSLPVRFIIDRAGITGSDGPTHAGSFDIMYLSNIPNFIVMAPSSASELTGMLKCMQTINHCPSAVRFPRGASDITDFNAINIPLIKIGKARIVKENPNQGLAIISIGTILINVEKAIKSINIDLTLIDARFAKPIDTQLIKKLADSYKALLIIEEGSTGGFATQVLDFLINRYGGKLPVIRTIHLADQFIEHGSIEEMKEIAGLGVEKIAATINEILNGI